MSTIRPAADDKPTFKVDFHFPPVFGYDGLSVLLGRSVASLQADRCRKPWTLPPACTPPGTKSPRWLLTDVLAWLEKHREPLVRPREPRQGCGRPTKAEEIAARQSAAGKVLA